MPADRIAWLRGAGARCVRVDKAPTRVWRLVLLGAPGVGKGTQSELLSGALGACALSMGDVLRTARTAPARSPAIVAAAAFMERGELVPDETVLEVLAERRGCLRCGAGFGFLLDGFPRTVTQAESLERLLRDDGAALDAVVSYELPIDTIVARLGGRRVCPGCKAVYHVAARPPRLSGRCDQCAGSLVQRADDQPEAIRTRMAAYERSTRPLEDFYRSADLLIRIAAEGTPEEIVARTLASPPFSVIPSLSSA